MSADYKIIDDNFVLRVLDGANISVASTNADGVAFRAWLDAGNTLDPADTVPAVIPQSVTMRQARMALLQEGLLDLVNNAVANLTGAAGRAAQIEWEFSSTVERDRPLVAAIAQTLNLSSEQLDALFILAATL